MVSPKASAPVSTGGQASLNIETLRQLRLDSIYVDACALRMKGNLQEALKLFLTCKEIAPANPAVSYELGTIYKMLGVNDLALANAKIAAASNPNNEWYQLLLVDCYNANRQYGQAVKVREALIRSFPDRADFKEDLAIQYSIVGQYEKAFRVYDEMEKTLGISEQLTMNKVKLLKQQNKIREMEAELLRLQQSDKSETRYYSYLADFYMENNQPQKAKAMYDQIIAIDPNNPVVNLALHDYYSSQGMNTDAFACLKKAFQNPDLDVGTKASIADGFYKRALEYNDVKSQENGMELAKIMMQIHPKSAEANLVYADFLSMDKSLREAVKHYYISATASKSNYFTWNKLLALDYELQNPDSLERHSDQAMSLFPGQPSNYLYNGIANMQLKNYKKAAQSLSDGLEYVSDNKTLMIDFYKSLGDAYNYLKDYEKSDQAFENALKVDADNTYVLNNYAYFLSLRSEHLEKAEKLSRRSNELRPNDRNYMDTYGWILYQQKKYKEAEEWLSGAAKLGLKNPNILEHYGDVLYRLKKPEEALLQWNAAHRAGGSSESLLKKIKEKKLND